MMIAKGYNGHMSVSYSISLEMIKLVLVIKGQTNEIYLFQNDKNGQEDYVFMKHFLAERHDLAFVN